ncbi:chorismate mutase [Hutsoniella sourekii]|uniref:chorismate mutase n=1 Tax=Hutsoniella sourekii TaxID=87650 RepID=UPI000486225E|nr:chorismate mutase [Hutsoniella sourekii]
MLDKQRQAIDQIDQEIVALFERRTQIVEEVAQIKYDHGKDILDTSRESQVIQKVQSYLTDPDLSDELADLYQHIMRISRDHQAKWMQKHKN